MEEEKKLTSSDELMVIHVKVIGGTPADVVRIGKDLEKLSKDLPYELHAIVTGDSVELSSIYELKKMVEEKIKEIEGEEN